MAEQAFVQQVSSLSLPFDSIPLSEFLPTYKATIIAELARGMGTSIEPLATTWAEKLFDVFISELYREQGNPQERTPSKTFLRDLNQLLRNAIEEGSNVSRWHEAITSFRRFFLPYLKGENLAFAENLWQQARVLVGQSAVRSELHRHWETNQRSDILRVLETALLTASTYEDLLESLSEGLRKLKINDFYLVLYSNPMYPSEMARLAFAYQNGHRINVSPEQDLFPAQQILPNFLLPHSGSACLVLESLHLGQDEHIGYIVFHTNPPEDASICDIYQALRIQLSSALKGIRLRQELHQAFTQAEEANKLKSHFLSMVSHELRTPLNLIVGLSEMALRQKTHGRRNSIEFQKKYLEQIYISGQHLDRLIRDVLDLANSQVGQMNLIRQPMDFIPVLNDVANMGEQLASQKNLDFHRNYPAALPKIWGDKTRLRQILLNLISNAVKFTAHGEVTLSAHLVNDQIQVSISDSGLGIPVEDQEKIFDEFYQSTRSTIRGYGGIGLGLAITRRLVEMHGGKIGVTSQGTEGTGSYFWFTLPILIENGVQDDILASPLPGSVYVIKDPKTNNTLLIDQLSQHGFKVQTIEMDKKGKYLKRLTVAPPGAIILDLSPSSEIGWQIIKYLKEYPSTQDIPVIFYSLIVEQEKGSVLELDFMEKPVKGEELINALERFGLKGFPGSNSPIILIIDDDPGILDLHARLVKEKMDKSLILTARNGLEGLDLMRKHIPHLVLLDLMMPELDGMGVLKIMQEDQKLRNIPVIILSAQVLTEREISHLNQGVATVLNKGIFTPEEVFERIENVLSRNKRLGNESQRLVQRGMGFIHEHYQEDISRGSIAQELCVNEQYLSRCFKNEIGIGPMGYLSRYRIEQAKKLLLEKEYLSITQVAMQVGLSSQSYFSRIFQQETGVSPSEFRRGK
jgi:signal transduction histidine kinase/DNA-binding response OmpR family regulator